MVFHGVIFALLIVLTPLMDVVLPPKVSSLAQAEEQRIDRMGGDKLAAATEDIRKLSTQDIQRAVEDLQRVRDEMLAIEKVKREEFAKATGRPMDLPPPLDAAALSRLKSEVDAHRKEADAWDQKARQADNEAARLEAEARGKNAGDAQRTLDEALRKRTESEAANERARSAEMQARNKSSRVTREEKLSSSGQHEEDLAGKSIPDLYESARSMEDDITEIYRNIRAGQLAMIRKLSFTDAVKMTDVAKPPRRELDRAALENPILEGHDFMKYQNELQKVSQELGDMSALAGSLSHAAQALTEAGK